MLDRFNTIIVKRVRIELHIVIHEHATSNNVGQRCYTIKTCTRCKRN